MIRFAWHSVTPADGAVPSGEWAGVRASTIRERKFIGAARRATCNTFLFAGCGGFIRLIVTDHSPRPPLHERFLMARAIRSTIARNPPAVSTPFSSSVFATAIALAPAALPQLRQVAAARRCENCTCIMKAGGPIDPDSECGRFVASELAHSAFVKRIAA